MTFADDTAARSTGPAPVPAATSGALCGMRVCVVGLNYAPEPTGSAPYTAGLAHMLVEHGAEVDAVAGVPHYPSWRVAPEYRFRLRAHELRDGVRVHRARHFVPHRQNALTRLAWEGTFLLNAGLVRPRRTPDVVIASTPALSGGVVGSRLAARHGVAFGVVVQDLVGQAARQSGVSGGGSVAAAAGAVESKVLRSARAVAVVSESFRPQVEAYGVDPARVEVLRNWTHIAAPMRTRDEVRRLLGWREDQFVVLHTGNIGMKQDLGNVVEAARLLSHRTDVVVVLMGDGNQRAAIEASAADVPTLRMQRPVSDDLYPDVLRAADLLLVNERPSVGDMSLPSKLTSYFAVGGPVLAAVSEHGACARELTAAGGAGVRIDPGKPDKLAATLEKLTTDTVRLDEMGQAGSAYANRLLSRSAASAHVLDFVRRLASSPTSPVSPRS